MKSKKERIMEKELSMNVVKSKRFLQRLKYRDKNKPPKYRKNTLRRYRKKMANKYPQNYKIYCTHKNPHDNSSYLIASNDGLVCTRCGQKFIDVYFTGTKDQSNEVDSLW